MRMGFGLPIRGRNWGWNLGFGPLSVRQKVLTLGTVSVVGRTTFLAQLFRAEPISKRFLTER